MTHKTSPRLSIILVTPNHYDTLRDVIRCYSAQSIAAAIEVVIAAPEPDALGIVESDFRAFHSLKQVRTPGVKDVGVLRAAAVLQASAALIVFGEDHSFPVADWAEILVERHNGPWAAVGPRVVNLNAERPQTWSQAYMEYGPWMTAQDGGERDQLPGHNSSFKRSYLLEYGEDLPNMILSEYNLFADLRGKGHRLYFEPTAVTRHLNFEHFYPQLQINYLAGRQFAAWRNRDFGLLRRLLYIFGSPLIPLIRMKRIATMLWENEPAEPLKASHLVYLVLNLVADGAGQFMGYAFGLSNTTEKIFPFEFYRTRFVFDPSLTETMCR